jgi:hypothetical protein
MHAHDRHRLNALPAIDKFEVNHRLAAMRVAFRARVYAGLAPDAAVWIDEEVEMIGLRHGGYC